MLIAVFTSIVQKISDGLFHQQYVCLYFHAIEHFKALLIDRELDSPMRFDDALFVVRRSLEHPHELVKTEDSRIERWFTIARQVCKELSIEGHSFGLPTESQNG